MINEPRPTVFRIPLGRNMKKGFSGKGETKLFFPVEIVERAGHFAQTTQIVSSYNAKNVFLNTDFQKRF